MYPCTVYDYVTSVDPLCIYMNVYKYRLWMTSIADGDGYHKNGSYITCYIIISLFSRVLICILI